MIFNNNHEVLLKNEDKIFPAHKEDGQNTHWVPVRSLMFRFCEPLVEEILLEYQLWNWKRRNNFCGVCGTSTFNSDDGAMECLACKEKFFPAQFPVVIVLIKKRKGYFISP